jgi:hypothetical protein
LQPAALRGGCLDIRVKDVTCTRGVPQVIVDDGQMNIVVAVLLPVHCVQLNCIILQLLKKYSFEAVE